MERVVLECTARAFLIAFCIGAVLFVLRVKAARVRHAVWASVVVCMLALPVWTAWGPKAVVRVLNPSVTPLVDRASISRDTSSRQAPQTMLLAAPTPQDQSLFLIWQRCLLGIYLLGFFALLIRLLIGTVRADMLVRRARSIAGRVTSASCVAPVTVGGLNPTVILPDHWRQWSQAQLDSILTHEGEHARWRDPLVQWLALLNRAVFWFHPLAWWLERRLAALSEEACDAAVLARGHDRFEYCGYLLEIARALQQNGARLNTMGMAMPGAFLPQRIRRIVEERPIERISRVRILSVGAVSALVFTVFTAGAMDHTQAVAQFKQRVAPVLARKSLALHPVSVEKPPKARTLIAQAQTKPLKPNASPTDAAQQPSGSISGAIHDPSGARVPGCLVVMYDRIGVHVEDTVRSDAKGLYRFASVPPGHYNLEYRMPGFARLKKEVEIEAGKSLQIDANLELGEASQILMVTAPSPTATPAPSATPPAPEPGSIVVGGRVEHARLVSKTDPIYPPDLRLQGIEATVRLEAIISRDGVPVVIRFLNEGEVDHRFVQAAMDAVSQWRYQPAKLNEHPVSAPMKIDVNFQLGK